VTNGSAALDLAVATLGLGPGDAPSPNTWGVAYLMRRAAP
jgi:hypothetical protein